MGLTALLQAPAPRICQLTLLPLKQGILSERKREPAGLSGFGGVTYRTENQNTRLDKTLPKELPFTEWMSWGHF